MEPLEIVKEIQLEVSRCRENRNLMMEKTEQNLIAQIKELKDNQSEIKRLLLGRLSQTENLQSAEDLHVRQSLDDKVSAKMFRWAVSLLAAGLIGGGILNYATLRSVQVENATFRLALAHHISETGMVSSEQVTKMRDFVKQYDLDQEKDKQ